MSASPPTRLLQSPSPTASTHGILLNGPTSPRRPQSDQLRPLNTSARSVTAPATSLLSPGLSSPGSTSGTSGDESGTPPTPAKLKFATPLPSSGKRRSNSITRALPASLSMRGMSGYQVAYTVGVAARAQLLSAQNGGAPVQRIQTAPQAPMPWYQGGPTPADVYTVSDAKNGLKKAWSKVKRRRSLARSSSASSSTSSVSTDSKGSPKAKETLKVATDEPGAGDATPRRAPSPPPEVEKDGTTDVRRRASTDPQQAVASNEKPDVLGFSPPLLAGERARTHDHSSEYQTEVWRSRIPSNDDNSSTASEEDGRDSHKDDEDDVEDDAEQVAMLNRKTSSAAGYELVERQKRGL